jgi:lipopolysaccharide export system permease protein
MITLIDRYIVKEWCKAMGVALMLIMGILILEDMYKYLKTFIEKGASLSTLMTYYTFMIPNCFHTILPVAFFISVLYVLNDMQAHNEVAALRAAGLTIFRITLSFWCVAASLTICMLIFNIQVLPYAADRIQSIVRSIDYNDQKRRHLTPNAIGVESNLSFYNAQKHRLWFFSQFSLYTYSGTYATLCLLDEQGKEVERINARSVRFDNYRNIWIFNEGKRWIFNKNHYEPTRFIAFDEYAIRCDDTPHLMKIANTPLKSLNMNDLKLILKFAPLHHACFLEHRVKYYSILSSPLILFMTVLLAVPFSLTGVRNNPMVGISKAAGLFFCYYIFSSLGRTLGAQGILSPLWAAWLPNILMLIVGIFLYKQLAPK